ncbi:Hsp20/alpha crystallin family protein [Parvularcula oceani]|uniref:Hsp20/alpha crystallin family protein n=1 Tax=Parvularcula oceani TaxID=1247963 RepID=UPI00138E09C0|nr:Hsp20/alpha crystallin family protein [Parvularcula oceani]
MARYGRSTPARTGAQSFGYGLSPFRMMDDLRREMDDVFGSYMADFAPRDGGRGHGAAFVPEIDIDRDGDRYLISVEAPGVRPEELTVDVENGVLTISGEKKEERQAEDGSRRERRYGRFSRSIRLAEDIDADRIEAHHEHGVLTISLPQRTLPEAERKRIEIRSAADGDRSAEAGDETQDS